MTYILDPTKTGGADISAYEAGTGTTSGIDFTKMANAGVKFMYTRASIGISTDAAFQRIWSDAKGKLPRGGYHFLYPSSVASIKQQAQLFASLLQSDIGELPPCVDVEYQEKDVNGSMIYLTASDVYGFITYLHEAFPVWPWQGDVVIYTGYYYWKDNIGSTDASWLKNPLWVANYQVTQPLIPLPWQDYDIWQFTSNGDGATYGTVSKSVDLDYLNPNSPLAKLLIGNGSTIPANQTGETMEQGTVSASALNVRSGPGTTYPVVGVILNGVNGTLLSGDVVVGQDNGAGWFALQSATRNGQPLTVVAGSYCSSGYLTGLTTVSTPPTPSALPAFIDDVQTFTLADGTTATYKGTLTKQ